MTEKPKVKVTPKYILPSQRVLDMIEQSKKNETPMSPVDISLTISLMMLDKLDENNLILRRFLPQPASVKK